MGLVLGGQPERETPCFSRQVAAAGDEGQLICDAVAAGVALTCDWFLQGVLHCAVVRARVVTGCFRICGCRSQCIMGSIIVVLLPCAWMHAGMPNDVAKRIVMAASRFLLLRLFA